MLSEIATLVGLAGSAATTISTTADLTQKFKDIINGPEPDALKMKELVLDIYDGLINAKRDQMQVEHLLADLQQELQKQDRFTTQAARYELTQTDMGARVYALKKDDPSGDPPHEICATCFEDAIKSILQPVEFNTLGCSRCGGKFFKSDGQSSIMSVPSGRDDLY